MDRRRFLIAGAGTLCAASSPRGLAARKAHHQIDVHHHLFPPAMRTVLAGRLPARTLADETQSMMEMDASGTSLAVISYPNSDITSMESAALNTLIQSSNDYAAALVMRYPARYRLFASLPMPHVDASLRELERIGKDFSADGVLLISNYGTKWLGDAQFAPLMEELNRRKMLVYVHPNPADCCKGLMPGIPDSIVEFQSDTSRTIASWLFSGAAERWRELRFLFSHSGGTLAALIERFILAPQNSQELQKAVPEGPLWYLKRFYYDTAQSANRGALGALMNYVPDTQILFGTDFPYRTAAEQVKQLEDMALGAQKLERILSGNARRLLHLN